MPMRGYHSCDRSAGSNEMRHFPVMIPGFCPVLVLISIPVTHPT